MTVPIQKISEIHGYSDRARATSDINHPSQRIAGLLAEVLDRGSSRICSGDDSSKSVTTLKQR